MVTLIDRAELPVHRNSMFRSAASTSFGRYSLLKRGAMFRP